MTLLTTHQAAEIIGVSAHEVRRLCRQGLLPAQRVGRDWLIRERDARVYVRAPRGSRPRKLAGHALQVSVPDRRSPMPENDPPKPRYGESP